MPRTSWLEVGAVMLTGALHPVFVELLDLRLAFIGVALLGWLSYVVRRLRRDKSLLCQWGFSRAGLLKSFAAASAIALPAAGVMAVIAGRAGSLHLNWHMLPLAILYPLWGLAQQFMVQGLVVRTLTAQRHRFLSSGSIAILAASLFALVHCPDFTLMALTFGLGLAFTAIYLRWCNLWPLGLYHGWLGLLCYFWVLQRDPWTEVMRHWV